MQKAMNRNLIQQARQVDLVTFMQSQGYDPKPESRSKGTYRIEGHGGLILKNNGFICFSETDNGQFKSYGAKKTTNLSGNAIDFVIWFFNVSFQTAIKMLLGQTLSTNAYDTQKKHQTPLKSDAPELVLPAQAANYKRLFAYLTKSRCINTSVVQKCLDDKLIYQDHNGNVVFLWYDKNKKIVGANLRGTLTDIPFKKNLVNNDMTNGFRIVIGKPKKLLVFEASIDALSMLTIRPNLTDTLLIAMNCLSQLPIHKALKDYPDIEKVFMCIDADNAADNFYNNLDLSIDYQRVLPLAPAKDWNESLQKKIMRE